MHSAPVDVEKLAAAIGLEIDRKPLFDNVSGKIQCQNGGPCKITVNSTHPETSSVLRLRMKSRITYFIAT